MKVKKKKEQGKAVGYPIEFSAKQQKKFEQEDNSDIIEFLERTKEWRESPSSNGAIRIR